MKNMLKILVLVILCVGIVAGNAAFISDALESLPFGSTLLSTVSKFIQDGQFQLPVNPVSWTINEILNTILIAVMSTLLGYVIGSTLFVYSKKEGILLTFQYFLCDFISIVLSCFIANEICNSFQQTLSIPRWVTQLILIAVFTFVDSVILSINGSKSGLGLLAIFSPLAIGVFLFTIFKSIVKMFLMVAVIVFFYLCFTIPEAAASLVTIAIMLFAIALMLSPILSPVSKKRY